MAKNITLDIAEKVLRINCEEEKGIRRLKKSLMKLPFIKSEKDLSTDRLEKIYSKLERRFNIHMGYINRHWFKDDTSYTYNGMIKDAITHEWIVTVSGKTIWEVYGKALFYLYYHVESKKQKGD